MKIKKYAAIGALAGALGIAYTGIKFYNINLNNLGDYLPLEFLNNKEETVYNEEPKVEDTEKSADEVEKEVEEDTETLSQETEEIVEEEPEVLEVEEVTNTVPEEYHEEYVDSTVVNFDDYFGYMDLSYDPYGEYIQTYIDQGYVTKYNGDFYHHNTSNFLNMFWQLQPGKEVIIGNEVYYCICIEHGYVYEHGIATDNNEEVFDNGTTEIITCDGEYDTPKRWIARLRTP